MEALQISFIAANSLAGAAWLGAAAIVLAAAPRRAVNRALFAYLVLYGLNALLYAPRILAPASAAAIVPFTTATAAALIPVYLLFVGLALETPLARPLKHKGAQWLLGVLAAAVFLAFAAIPRLLYQPDAASERGFVVTAVGAVVGGVLAAAGLAVALFTTVASLHAWRRAAVGSLERRRMGSYAVAFMVNDASLAAGFVDGFGVGTVQQQAILSNIVSPALGLVFVALLVRALLRDQLFDFDLRVKRGVKRGTIAGIFIAVFVIVSQVAQNFLSGQYGWLVGGVVTGLLLLALRPLERLAVRIADRAVPKADASPAYVAYRKVQVYRAQVEMAWDEGGVDEQERAFLDELRANLGLTTKDAQAVEHDVAAQKS